MTLALFSPEPQANLLPYDGHVQDFGLILGAEQSEQYFEHFLTQLAWQHDEVVLYGKRYVTDRKVAWYGDAEYEYHYSGSTKQAHFWEPKLFLLKQQIEQLTGQSFNSCLANLYAHGRQAVGWHSDDEPSLRSSPQDSVVIASLSLGATRKFCFKHQTQAEKVELMLHSGQLIVMRGQTQRYWKHALMKSSKITEPRINLTFRYFYPTN